MNQQKNIYPGSQLGRYTKPTTTALNQSEYLLYVTQKCNLANLINDHIPIATNGNSNKIYGCGS